jgi:RNA polymerase sigma-70 factor, ECF subfamily
MDTLAQQKPTVWLPDLQVSPRLISLYGHAMPSPVEEALSLCPCTRDLDASERAAWLARLTYRAEEAARAWPEIHFERDNFIVHMLGKLEGEDALARFGAMHVADLLLAFCASLGIPSATRTFEDLAMKDVDTVARKYGGEAWVPELRQAVRVRLLVADGRAHPRAYDYSGAGPLAGWVRVTAVRLALDMRSAQKGQKQVGAEALDAFAHATEDMEVDFLRARYGQELREAMHHAVERLSDEERTVLQMHYVRGLSMDEVGGLLQVHRATIARWVQSARASLRDETRARLHAKLGLRGEEAESLLGLVDSRFQASLMRVLGG